MVYGQTNGNEPMDLREAKLRFHTGAEMANLKLSEIVTEQSWLERHTSECGHEPRRHQGHTASRDDRRAGMLSTLRELRRARRSGVSSFLRELKHY